MALRKIHEETAGKFMVRVYRDTPNREYVARIYVNDVWQPAADAFETECGAAIDTARAMLAHSVKQAAAPAEQPAAPAFHAMTIRTLSDWCSANNNGLFDTGEFPGVDDLTDDEETAAREEYESMAHQIWANRNAAPTEQPTEQPAPATIDATPQWCGLFPVYRAVMLDGTRKGREALMPEVARLCAAMDAMNAISATLTEEQSQAFARALARGLSRCGY